MVSHSVMLMAVTAVLCVAFASAAAELRTMPSVPGSTLRLRGGSTASKIVRAMSVEKIDAMVVSKKNRMKETLTDYMRELAIEDPELRDLEAIFSGIQSACRSIADMVSKAGVQDLTGLAGTGENIQGEEQKKLDILSNDVFKDKLTKTGCMAFLGSEEEDDAVHIKGKYGGDYVAVFDPLDGSSNIDAAISVGTIFGIYKANGAKTFPLVKGSQQWMNPCGKEQIAAGYCMYSTATILMITLGDKVNGFTLDHSSGDFVLTHPEVRIPTRGKIYSCNQGNAPAWPAGLTTYFKAVTHGEGQSKNKYSLRYIVLIKLRRAGSMVGDMHRTLLYGGLFLYPADAKNKGGKLRLLYEANPMAMLVEAAGGKALVAKDERVLDIQPAALHQRVPIFIGSAEDVEEVVSYL